MFVQGCPWRCGYCHNPRLQARPRASTLAWREVLSLLERRRGLLDAVVFCGGEPTLDPGLPGALRETRAMGYAVGLHSAGVNPRHLLRALPYVDWVALDVKAPPVRYAAVTGVSGSGEAAWESVRAVLTAGVEHEFRLTYHSALLDEGEVLEAATLLARMGARSFALQAFRAEGCISDALRQTSSVISSELVAALSGLFERFSLRAA